jgi:hypothetical protein
MTQMKVRWGDLGSPTQAGQYVIGLDAVSVTRADIELAKGNADTIFTAIQPDFYSTDTYLLGARGRPTRSGLAATMRARRSRSRRSRRR